MRTRVSFENSNQTFRQKFELRSNLFGKFDEFMLKPKGKSRRTNIFYSIIHE